MKTLAMLLAAVVPVIVAVPAGAKPARSATRVDRTAPSKDAEKAPAAKPEASESWGLLVEPRLGGAIPFNRLESSGSLALQVGRLVLPERRLWAVVELSYARPTLQSRGGTPDAPVGAFRYRITMHDVGIFAGARMMFRTPIERLTPFAEGGLKLHVLHSKVEGASETRGDFGDNAESSLAPGLALRGGSAYRLGPGAVSLAVELGYTRVSQDVTGDANVVQLGIFGGYLYQF